MNRKTVNETRRLKVVSLMAFISISVLSSCRTMPIGNRNLKPKVLANIKVGETTKNEVMRLLTRNTHCSWNEGEKEYYVFVRHLERHNNFKAFFMNIPIVTFFTWPFMSTKGHITHIETLTATISFKDKIVDSIKVMRTEFDKNGILEERKKYKEFYKNKALEKAVIPIYPVKTKDGSEVLVGSTYLRCSLATLPRGAKIEKAYFRIKPTEKELTTKIWSLHDRSDKFSPFLYRCVGTKDLVALPSPAKCFQSECTYDMHVMQTIVSYTLSLLSGLMAGFQEYSIDTPGWEYYDVTRFMEDSAPLGKLELFLGIQSKSEYAQGYVPGSSDYDESWIPKVTYNIGAGSEPAEVIIYYTEDE